jgi:hypothetical protein
VLTHEALIDAMWDVKIKPLLVAAYPQSTPDQLKMAHGYAYGGSIIQDLGYYPHGSKQFSDLTHYVRTGDFVLTLIGDSKEVNELAFALGALSHYVSDIDIHRGATNVGEGKLYPKLQRKYGNVITYEEDPAAHLKTEFGFDVLEVARGNFAPQAYHDFIGFYVSTDLLRRVFLKTYGVDLKDLSPDFDRSVESYRRAVSKLIPRATRIAWAEKQDEIQQTAPGITRQRFVYVMKRSSYERNWGKNYDRPGFWDRFLAFFLKLVPPIGPLRALHFKMPTPEVEQLFMASFTHAAQRYQSEATKAGSQSLQLADVNFDIGEVTNPGQYRLEDDAYVWWLNTLAKQKFATVDGPIRATIVDYLSSPAADPKCKQKPEQWSKVIAELNELKSTHPTVSSGAF